MTRYSLITSWWYPGYIKTNRKHPGELQTDWINFLYGQIELMSRPGLQFGCLLKNELMLSRKDVLLNWELNTTASATVAVRI